MQEFANIVIHALPFGGVVCVICWIARKIKDLPPRDTRTMGQQFFDQLREDEEREAEQQHIGGDVPDAFNAQMAEEIEHLDKYVPPCPGDPADFILRRAIGERPMWVRIRPPTDAAPLASTKPVQLPANKRRITPEE